MSIERQYARIRRDVRLAWDSLTPSLLYGGLDPRRYPQYRLAVAAGTLHPLGMLPEEAR